jgi:hypothetical protein
VIVQNPDAAPPGTAWLVDSVPLVSIGTQYGSEDYQFTGISAVVLMPDGRYAVADGSNTVRFFDRAGRFVSRSGRDGEGPGEFRHIGLMSLFGKDSLFVWDFPLRRMSILTAAGRFVRSAAVPELPGFLVPVGVFGDGTVLGEYSPPLDLRTVRPGIVRGEVLYLRFDWRSGKMDTVASLEPATSYVSGEGHLTVVVVPFAANPVAVAAGNDAYLGAATTFEVRRYRGLRGLDRVVRLDRRPVPLTRSLIASFTDRLAAKAQGDGAKVLIRERYADLPYPQALPSYRAMLVDALRDLWVEVYTADPDAPPQWMVFDSLGHLAGQVGFPERFSPYVIDSDRVVGVATDTVGVERVEELKLSRGQYDSGHDGDGITQRR